MKPLAFVFLVVGIGSTIPLAAAEIRCDASLTNNSQIQISWTATPGENYVVLNSATPQGPWRDLPTVPPLLNATGSSLSQVFPRSAGAEFFRVLQVSIPPGMAYVAAGSFTMGDSFWEGPFADAVPPHPVYLSACFVEKWEVSKSLWDSVRTWAITNGYSFEHSGAGKAADHPMQTVSWFDAVKWCNARSEMEALPPVYYLDADLTAVYRTGQVAPCVNWNARGYRLPTEAEWEKAARGGASGRRERKALSMG